METFLSGRDRQKQWTNISIQTLADFILDSILLSDGSKAQIAESLPHIQSFGERVRASGWVVLSIIADSISLRSHGVFKWQKNKQQNFRLFKKPKIGQAVYELRRRTYLELDICNTSLKHLNKLRKIADAEVTKCELMNRELRIEEDLLQAIEYVNIVLKGIFSRLSETYLTGYDELVSYWGYKFDAITTTKGIGDFALRLKEGRVSGNTLDYYDISSGWNELSLVVYKHLGPRSLDDNLFRNLLTGLGIVKGVELTEAGKQEIMNVVEKLKTWQGINELSIWGVTHIAMRNIMAYGKVNCIYRAIYGYKGNPNRTWVMEGWVIRYVAVQKREDGTFKVPTRDYWVSLKQNSAVGELWIGERVEIEETGTCILSGEYEGMLVCMDPNIDHTIKTGGCLQQ